MSSTAATVAPPPRQAHLYLRISRDDAHDQLGVARQERSLRELADRNGWIVASVHADNDQSAYRGAARDGYSALLEAVRPGDAIVVSEITRLTRHPRELEDLVEFVERNAVDIVAQRAGQIDLATSGGRAVARLLGTFARMESEQIGERVAAKHRENAAKGKAHGGPAPYGYRRAGRGELEIDEEQAAQVRWMVDEALAGKPVTRIVIELNERGVPSARGGKWQTSSVGKLLRSPSIAGYRVAGGEIVGDAQWPGIITRAEHERLVSKLNHAPVGPRARRNVLAGFLYCGECGGRLYGRTDGRTGNRGRQYACDKAKGGGGCGSNSASAEHVEDHVLGLVIGTAATVDLTAARARRAGDDASALTEQLVADETLLADLAADLGEQRLTRAEWIAAREPITRRIDDAKSRLAAMNAAPVDTSVADGLTLERWDALSFDQRRQVIDLFVERVTIAKGRPGRNFDYSRISIDWKV